MVLFKCDLFLFSLFFLDLHVLNDFNLLLALFLLFLYLFLKKVVLLLAIVRVLHRLKIFFLVVFTQLKLLFILVILLLCLLDLAFRLAIVGGPIARSHVFGYNHLFIVGLEDGFRG